MSMHVMSVKYRGIENILGGNPQTKQNAQSVVGGVDKTGRTEKLLLFDSREQVGHKQQVTIERVDQMRSTRSFKAK
ncbi:MAG TPA: hypothetical protein DCS66_01085 [Flavobacteriaceae bacterium]|nr:hypothetical protein [Flavobacteriaceae bacterium]